MDVVHLAADGALPEEHVSSRDGSRTAIVIRDPFRQNDSGVSTRVCKGWATPALCNSCGALVGIRGLLRPAGLPLWRRLARASTCPQCHAKGVLPLAADTLVPVAVMGLPIPLAAVGGILPWRVFPNLPTAVNVLLTVFLAFGFALCGFLLAGLRWTRGQNRVRDWFSRSRCPKCGAVGLAHRRDLGHFGCMAGDDPFEDWLVEDQDPDSGPGWRVLHFGLHHLIYKERIAGRWERLEIGGEMLDGTPHHVIYFDSAAKWRSYPEWVRDRRSQIIGRVKEACPPPDYAYEGEIEPEGERER